MPGGGFTCSIGTCNNNSEKIKKSGITLAFHSFPVDNKLRKEWVRRCYRKDNFNPNNKRICSHHFAREDYEDAIEASIKGVLPKRLKSGALPTLNLRSDNIPSKPGRRDLKIKKKQHDEIIKELLIPEVNVETQSLLDSADELPGTSSESDHDKLLLQFNSMLAENESLKNQLKASQTEVTTLKAENCKLMSDKHGLTNELGNQIDENVKYVLKDILSPNQIEILLKKKKRTRWNSEEISRAFTLRYFSKRAYTYVRNTLKYPLPGISTLQDWARNIDLRNGLLKDILRVMDLHGQTKNGLSRIVVLSFDEIKVSSLYEYDQKADEVIGNHTYMQTVMARGLFDSWKQPVYINFDTKMTKEILDEVVTALHDISFKVVACVSDCGGGNLGLWKELGISYEKTHYDHPLNLRIYFFADVPHLLKLIRNWLLDTGFVLADETIITKEPLKALIDLADTEISSCHKLSSLHITCERTERQNVSLAAQLLSNTAATALRRYSLGDDKKQAQNLADFIELVGAWFDIFNSYTPIASVPTKQPYGGIHLENQNGILEKVKKTFLGMRCTSKKALQVFQKGVVMSTMSLQKLYEDLASHYDVKYILTHRLNQDCLENFFSQLRTRGGLHDHPSPLNALYRVRMIILGKNPGIVQKRTNVSIETDGNYLLSTAFKKACIQNVTITPHEADLTEDPSIDSTLSQSSGSSSSSTSQDISPQSQVESDGLIYIAGYLARKFKEKYPDLGSYTHEMQKKEMHTYSMPSWVQSLSFGGLTEPSPSWKNNVFKMDKYFMKYHKNTFKEKKNIIKNTVAYMSKKIKDVPLDLIKGFVRQRVFVRIKYLNEENKAKASTLKRRRGDDDLDRRKRKKIIKLST